MSLSARDARSIAETDQEATAEEDEGADESSSQSSGSHSGEEGQTTSKHSHQQQQQQHRYSFSTSTFTRSPYITRSSSKTRSNAPSFTGGAAAAAASKRGIMSPTTRTLSFVEGEEEDESSDSVGASPLHRSALKARSTSTRFASSATTGASIGARRGTPGTPGERFAHDDAGVYQQDVCDSHEVRMPDGSVAYRPHDCSSRHAHTYSSGSGLASSSASSYRARQWSPSPASAAAEKKSASKRLGLYMLLTMLMIGLLGPWALKQLTSRPPSFVAQSGAGAAGRDRALMTQAELDQIIEHVRDSVRADLASKQLVDQHGLDRATSTLAEQISTDRTRFVSTSVAAAVRDVYTKMDARILAEGERDASALAAVRKEVLDAMEVRTERSAREWSQRAQEQFAAALQGETAERKAALQQLSVMLTTRADSDRAESLSARQTLRAAVLAEVETLLRAEHDARLAGQADFVTRAEVESKLAALVRAENEEDAATLSAALASARAEFQGMIDEKLEGRLREWEGVLRAKIMAQAHEAFAPLSAVVAAPAVSTDGTAAASAPAPAVNEEALIARLKAHLVLLVSQIELPAPKEPKEPKEPREPKEPKEPKEPREPREVDEAALEARLASRVGERVDDLAAAQQRSLQAAVEGQVESLLQRTLSSLREELPGIIAPLIPKPAPTPAPVVVEPAAPAPDHSGAIQELYSQVEALKAELQAARDAAALATQRQQERELQWQALQEEREKATAAKAAEAAAEAAEAVAEAAAAKAAANAATAAAAAAATPAVTTPAAPSAEDEAQRVQVRQMLIEQADARKRMDALSAQLQLAQNEAEAARQAALAVAEASKNAAAVAVEQPTAVTPGPDYSDELATLQSQIAALNDAMTAAAAAAASTTVPATAQAVPAAEDHSAELAALHASIASLRAEMERAQNEDAERVRARDVALLKEAIETASAAAAAAVAAIPAPVAPAALSGAEGSVDPSALKAAMSREIDQALERYSADRTGRVDYALRSSGGRVIASSPGHQVPLEGNVLTRLVKRCFLATKKPEEMFNVCFIAHFARSGSAR